MIGFPSCRRAGWGFISEKSPLSAHLFTFAYYFNNPYRISLKKLPVH
jgi:hypothetical protein